MMSQMASIQDAPTLEHKLYLVEGPSSDDVTCHWAQNWWVADQLHYRHLGLMGGVVRIALLDPSKVEKKLICNNPDCYARVAFYLRGFQ